MPKYTSLINYKKESERGERKIKRREEEREERKKLEEFVSFSNGITNIRFPKTERENERF